jgi:hypothetical protein
MRIVLLAFTLFVVAPMIVSAPAQAAGVRMDDNGAP